MYNTTKQSRSSSLQSASGSLPSARSFVVLFCTLGLPVFRYPVLSVFDILGLSGLFFGFYFLLLGFLWLLRFCPESLANSLSLVSIIGI